MDRIVFFGSIFTGEAQNLRQESKDQPTLCVALSDAVARLLTILLPPGWFGRKSVT